MQNGPSKNPLTSIQFEEAKKHTDSIKIEQLAQIPPPLSEELWLNILSYLNPQDTLLLKKTNTFFYQFASDYALWRAHIARYFPYLKTTHAEEYAENPYKLFFDEVLKYLIVEPIPVAPFRFLLLALKGSLEAIEQAALDALEKKLLYLFAARNGHLTALTKLESSEKAESFVRACSDGNLAAAQSLFQHCAADITNQRKGRALQEAIRYGHLSVATWLLEFLNHIPNYEKNICALEAVKENQIVIFQKLLSVMPASKNNHHLHFITAAEHHAFLIATFLLEQFGPPLASAGSMAMYTNNLLVSASKAGKNRLVTLLLENWQALSDRSTSISQATEAAVETDNLPLVQILCPHDTYTAIFFACEKGKLTIAQWMFEYYKNQIDADEKGFALYNAAISRQIEMMAWLLAEFGTPSFKRRLPRGLKWLSAFSSSSWMQWILHKTASTISREAKEKILIGAAKRGDVPTLQFLLSQIEEEVPTQHKCVALKVAAKAGNLDTLQYLLEQCSPAYFAASLRKNMLWSFLEHLTLLPVGFLENRAAKMSAEIKEAALQLAAKNNHYKVVIWLITEYKNVLSLDAKIHALKSFIYPHHAAMDEFLDIMDTELSDTQRGELLAHAAMFNKPAALQCLLERWNARISTFYKNEAMRNALAFDNNRASMELLSQYCDKEIFGSTKTYVPLQAAGVTNSAEASSHLDVNESVLRATLS